MSSTPELFFVSPFDSPLVRMPPPSPPGSDDKWSPHECLPPFTTPLRGNLFLAETHAAAKAVADISASPPFSARYAFPPLSCGRLSNHHGEAPPAEHTQPVRVTTDASAAVNKEAAATVSKACCSAELAQAAAATAAATRSLQRAVAAHAVEDWAAAEAAAKAEALLSENDALRAEVAASLAREAALKASLSHLVSQFGEYARLGVAAAEAVAQQIGTQHTGEGKRE